MSKYPGPISSNQTGASNFPDINNPQPVTAPGGKRSGRVLVGGGLRNEPLGQGAVFGGGNGPPPLPT